MEINLTKQAKSETNVARRHLEGLKWARGCFGGVRKARWWFWFQKRQLAIFNGIEIFAWKRNPCGFTERSLANDINESCSHSAPLLLILRLEINIGAREPIKLLDDVRNFKNRSGNKWLIFIQVRSTNLMSETSTDDDISENYVKNLKQWQHGSRESSKILILSRNCCFWTTERSSFDVRLHAWHRSADC